MIIKDKKIDFFGRFFDEKSVFGGDGKDFLVEKSFAKKSAKNRQKSPIFRKKIGKNRRFFGKNPIFSRKNPIFPEKNPIFPKFGVNYILGH